MYGVSGVWFFVFFKQKTAYEMRISDWSSDVCSSDLVDARTELEARQRAVRVRQVADARLDVGVEAQEHPVAGDAVIGSGQRDGHAAERSSEIGARARVAANLVRPRTQFDRAAGHAHAARTVPARHPPALAALGQAPRVRSPVLARPRALNRG